MFKLPLLKPYLTGQNGVEGQKFKKAREESSKAWASRQSDEHGAATGPVEARSWDAQVGEFTSPCNRENFSSVAVYAETKLKEALKRCEEASEEGGECALSKPHRMRTGVCCQVLGELSGMCGPFNSVIKMIWKELVKSIYSDFYWSENGTLSFDQVPYFVAAERLAAEKLHMLEEREMWKKELLERQEDVLRIEQQLTHLRTAFKSAENENRELDQRITEATAKERRAVLESQIAKSELLNVRQEVLTTKETLDKVTKAYEKLKANSSTVQKELMDRATSLRTEMEEGKKELSSIQSTMEARVPRAELDKSLAKIEHLEDQLALSQQEILQLRHTTDRIGTMTPRPDWQELSGNSAGRQLSGSTCEISGRLVKEVQARSEEGTVLKDSLLHAEALLQPEPLPCAHTLDISVQSADFFVTETGDEGRVEIEVAGALGYGPNVPRFLRSNKAVKIKPMDISELKALLDELWERRETWDEGKMRLQDFVFHFLLEKHGNPESAVQAGYQLLHGCKSHETQSTQVKTFLGVLEGRMPCCVYEEVGRMLQAVSRTLAALASAPDAVTNGVVSYRTLTECFRRLFPAANPSEISNLARMLSMKFSGDGVPPAALVSNACSETIPIWPEPPSDLSELFETTTTRQVAKFQKCIESMLDALRLKSATPPGEHSPMVDYNDIKATLEAQNIEDANGLWSVLKVNLGDQICWERNQAPLAPILNFLRVESAFKLARGFDLEAGLAFSRTFGAVDGRAVSGSVLPNMA